MLIYLHIPFCHRVCPYCSFYKHTPGDTPIGSFIDALITETATRLPDLPSPRTLYLGGGTPSMLSPAHLRRLFDGLARHLDLSSLDDITLEANPATFDHAKASLFRDLGVRRVSLGIQSFAPHVLSTLGREHSPEQASESVAILRQAGMPSVNIDLMFSIPGLTKPDWRQTLEHTIRLQPDHISAYNLTYEEDTAFFDSLQSGRMDENEDRDATQFFLAHDLLTTAGFDHYETSNYARPGHHSAHNRGYWQGEDYLGLGPSAVSTLQSGAKASRLRHPSPAAGDTSVRTRNIPDTARYVRMIETLGHATSESETLTADQLRLERIALLLRTTDGVPLTLLDPVAYQPLLENHLASLQNDHLTLTRQGSALVDPIATQLA